jgi:hypothetical protein
VHAGVLDAAAARKLREPLSAIKPMKAVFDPNTCAHQRPQREEAAQDGQGGDADGRHPQFKEPPGAAAW